MIDVAVREHPMRPGSKDPDEAGAPSLGLARGTGGELSHALFQLLNRVVRPVHRAGLSAWLGTPLTGYQLLLRCHGRRSGLVREIPLGYVIRDGAAWLLAGYGQRTAWLRNIEVDPRVELVLPGRVVAGNAFEETDPSVRAAVVPRLVRSFGLVGLLVGCVPWITSDERILELVADVPLVRVDSSGQTLVAGPDDPGGLAWTWRQAVALGLAACLLRRVIGSRSARA